MARTPEQRAADNRKANKNWRNKPGVREARREYQRKRSADKTPEQKEAERVYRRQYREANKEHINAKNRRVYLKNSEVWILGNIRMRAKQKGLPCTITVDDIRMPELCPVLGIPLFRNRQGSKGGPGPNSPAVDRIRPELGYVPGNVIVVSHKANCIKQNATPAEIRAVADFYDKLSQEENL